MANSNRDSISQRIELVGDAEVRRQLEAIGSTGERALGNVARGAAAADTSLQAVGRSSTRVGGAVQNLGFQVNDLATSLASGAPVMQVFAQQGGQIVQAFQQGGGMSAVLGGVTAKLKEFITPARTAGAAAIAAGAGFAALLVRAADSDSAIRQFKVTLDALRNTQLPQILTGGTLKNFTTTPQQLEDAAKRLRSAGLTVAEARQEILDVIRAGIDPKLSEQVVRFGKDLDAAFGEKGARSGDAFKKAFEGGSTTLRKFGQDIGAINPRVTELQDGLRDVPSLLRKITEAPNIKGAAENVLSPLTREARDLRVQFNDALDQLANFSVQAVAKLDAVKLWVETTSESFGIPAAFRAAFTSVSEIVTGAFASLKATFSPENLMAAWTDTAKLVEPFTNLGSQIIDALTSSLAGADPFQVLVDKAAAAANAIQSVFSSLLDQAAAVGQSIFNSISKGSAEFPASGFAAGGLVHGPGTGTSDSILARLSRGEFVVKASAVPANLSWLEAINNGAGSLMPRRTRFATGGLVTAGAGAGGTINLHLEGAVFPTKADPDVFASLSRTAREKQMLSAGRKPGWAGGRRYGG